MIKHTVFFKLKHPLGSAAQARFLERAAALAQIPDVRNFQRVRQVSAKNDFDWGLLMDFADQAAYDRYNGHPDHTKFVTDHWLVEVESFLELDYVGD